MESDVEVQLVECFGKIQVDNIHILSTLKQRQDFVVVGKIISKIIKFEIKIKEQYRSKQTDSYQLQIMNISNNKRRMRRNTTRSCSSLYRRTPPQSPQQSLEEQNSFEHNSPEVNTSSQEPNFSISTSTSSTSMIDTITDTMNIYISQIKELRNELREFQNKMIKNERKYKKKLSVLRTKITKFEQKTNNKITAQTQKMNQQYQIHKNDVSKQIELQITTPPQNRIIYDDAHNEEVFSPTKPLRIHDDEEDEPAEVVEAAVDAHNEEVFSPTKPLRIHDDEEDEPAEAVEAAVGANAAAEVQTGANSSNQHHPPSSPSTIINKITIQETPIHPSTRKRCEIPPPAELDIDHRKNIDALLAGTSIIKHVRGGQVKRKCGKRAKVCSFPGASSEKVRKQTEIELEYYKPKIAIIHSGGNDLAEQKRGDEIVKEISSMAQLMYDTGVRHIGVSAVTPRVGLAYEIQDLNFRLKNMCAIQGLNFIEHPNILFRNHVCHDGVHLNYEGVNILTNNFSNYLRSVGLEDEK